MLVGCTSDALRGVQGRLLCEIRKSGRTLPAEIARGYVVASVTTGQSTAQLKTTHGFPSENCDCDESG